MNSRLVATNLPIAESFDGGFGFNWTVVDEAGNPSNWAIVGNQYHQQNQVRASVVSVLQTYHLGSYSYLSEGFGLTDYRLTVDVTPLGDKGDNIGVMFRYQDENNYYRLSIDSRYGFTRLEKRVGSTFTTLARNAKGYDLNQLYNVVVEANGSKILVTLDGEALFAVDDASLSTGTVALYASSESAFDSLVIDPITTTADIIISSPSSDSVEASDTFTVTAIVSNFPAGGSVDFMLDGLLQSSDNTPPFTATFAGVSQGNHTVSVDLYDVTTTLIDSDSKTNVGVSGDNIVSIGDSITNGSADNYATDNKSSDGRQVGFSGHHEVLNDLLTAAPSQMYPHIIFNEGIGGDDTLDATTRTSSILERHPNANKAHIMLGTNDASGTLSTSASVYRSNMNTVLSALPVAMEVTVAIPPPVFGSGGTPFANPSSANANAAVRNYRSVITNDLTGIQVGPDFYKCFLEEANYISLFVDVLHPNGLGHEVMGALWGEVLTGAMTHTDPCVIPTFVLKNLDPSTTAPYLKQNLIEVGDEVYIDEAFALLSLPAGLGLETAVWVMTANADSANNDSVYATFDIDRDVTVYIAYDIDTSGGSGELLPDWMVSEGYTDTTFDLTVSGLARPLRLFSATFDDSGGSFPVSVSLGGNLATGASGASNHYLVIVVEN